MCTEHYERTIFACNELYRTHIVQTLPVHACSVKIVHIYFDDACMEEPLQHIIYRPCMGAK